MSGVFGCWQLDGRHLDAAMFHQCLTRISPHGPDDIEAWTQGAIGLGCRRSPSTMDRAAERHSLDSDASVCVFDGRIDNRDDLVGILSRHSRVTLQSRDRDLALAAYDRFGDSFAEHIQGDFAVAIFDRRTDRLLLARDRLGLRPLCYSDRNGAFVFGSEAKAILAYPGMTARPDDVMFADFVLYFRAADAQRRTFFRDIQSLPAGHHLIVTPRGVTMRRYFDFDTTRQIRLPAFGDYVEAFHHLFTASVRKRLRCARPVAISVSGGLDSAYIFCLAHRAMRDGTGQCPGVVGVNYAGSPGAPSEEGRFVVALEEASGTPIDRIAQRAGFMASAGDEVWHSESPIVEGLACQGQAVLRHVSESGAGRFMTGHWGDQLLSDSDYIADLLRQGRWRLLARHARGWRMGTRGLAVRLARGWASRHLPGPIVSAVRHARSSRSAVAHSPWYTPRFRQLLRQRAADAGLPTRGGTSHAWAVYQQSRLGYHVQCMEWNSRIGAMHGLDVAFPYLDCDLIQFLMSIPGEIQSHDGVPRGLMRHAMRGIVPDTIINRNSKGEFTQLTNQSIEGDFAAISEILGPSALSVRLGYVDGPVLWKLLPQWRAAIRRANDAVLTNRVVDLCGFELLLRAYFPIDEARAPVSQAIMATC
jgi:asparagine synthase (glutamine-hydrolysing)